MIAGGRAQRTTYCPLMASAGAIVVRAMSNRAHTKDLWESILRAYREHPGNHQAAARKAGVSRRAAKRAWEKGWTMPKLAEGSSPWNWGGPIKLKVTEEQESMRHAREEKVRQRRELEEAAFQARRRAAEEATDEEAKLLTTVRKDVLSTALVVWGMMPAAKAAAELIRSMIVGPGGGLLPNTSITPGQALKIIEVFTKAAERVARVAEPVVEAGVRSRKGALPVEVIDAPMDDEAIIEELAAAASLHDRLVAHRARNAASTASALGSPIDEELGYVEEVAGHT